MKSTFNETFVTYLALSSFFNYLRAYQIKRFLVNHGLQSFNKNLQILRRIQSNFNNLIFHSNQFHSSTANTRSKNNNPHNIIILWQITVNRLVFTDPLVGINVIGTNRLIHNFRYNMLQVTRII